MLRIGKGLTLPHEAVTQTFGIIAKRGAGKTYTALVLVEEMLKAELRVVVADPVGVCWGLRASADGKREGLSILVMGGEHGDLPLEPTAGELVADLVVDEGISAVLDLSLMRKGQQVRFMTDFAERLYHRNRDPLHLVLDEADAFAPQRPQPGQQRMLGAVEDLVRRGRARGIGISLITQRAAVINKDVLTQVEVLVALRTIAPHDRAAVKSWVVAHGDPEQQEVLLTSLASLPRGTAWFWSPGWLDIFQRVQVRRRETFDSSATPTAGGRKARAPKKLAQVDLDSIRGRMAETVERARENDPRHLRKRIAELERQLADQKPQVDRVEVPVLTDSDLERLEEVVAGVGEFRDSITEAVTGIQEALAKVRNGHGAAAPRRAASPVRTSTRAERTAAVGAAGAGGSVGSGVPGGGQRRILVALAQHPAGLTRQQIGVFAGLSSRSGTFTTYLGRLRRQGFLADGETGLVITAAGIEALGGFEPLPTGQELLDYWLARVGGGQARILRVLAAVHPGGLDRHELAFRAELSASSGTFTTYLGRLRSLELIEGRQEIRASDTFFT